MCSGLVQLCDDCIPTLMTHTPQQTHTDPTQTSETHTHGLRKHFYSGEAIGGTKTVIMQLVYKFLNISCSKQ